MGTAGKPAPEYVGLTPDQATELAHRNGKYLRIGGDQGRCYALSADARPDRVTVDIWNGVVRDARIF